MNDFQKAANLPEDASPDLQIVSPNQHNSSVHVGSPAQPADSKFDPKRYRQAQTQKVEESATWVRKLQTVIPVRKPSKKQFVRAHHSAEYRADAMPTITDEGTGEVYLLSADLELPADLENKVDFLNLTAAMTADGSVFLWPYKNSTNSWCQSARIAVSQASRQWVRVSPDMSSNGYLLEFPMVNPAEPNWPPMTFPQILETAFGARYIDSLQHPQIKKLRGTSMSRSLSTLDGFFREVVLLDTEFVARDGDRVLPVCLVARELRSGRLHQLFFDDLRMSYENPLPMGDDVLYVAYAAHAEWSVFLALGWQLPEHTLDLFAEFRCVTNGLTKADGTPVESSLIAALIHYGLDSMTVVEKESMRDLILRGHPYSEEERQAILDYCAEDVEALELLLPAMLPKINMPYPIFRGRYTKALASMEFSGIPIDVVTFDRLKSHWDVLKGRLAREVEAEHRFGVYDGTRWGNDRFETLLDRMGILPEWPRTPSGLLSLEDDDVFKPMAMRFPELAPLRELRSTLTHLRELKTTVGADGRNRCSLMPFRSVTGRNYPPSSKFIFGPSTWLRSLIKPEVGRAIAYIDWSSAEFGIAAALSGDARMKAAYESGDIYMAFAIEAGAAPMGATKNTHRDVRDLYKIVVLAVQYGQTAVGLAKKLGQPTWRAQELLDLHRRVYAQYWRWSEWMSQSATFGRKIETVFGWPMHVTPRTKPNTVSNFPMQANGSEMLRWACCFAAERGIEIHAPVQDALLVGGSAEEIEHVVAATQEAMAQASDLVLDGFILRSDAKIVKFPDRYADERGVAMWDRMMRLLDAEELNSAVAAA